MRIAFDYQTFALQSYGGISRYFTRLAQNLLEMNQQVGIFAPLHRNNYLRELPEGTVSGLRVNGWHPRAARLIMPYNRFKSRSAISKWRPDLVHETYFSRRRSAPRTLPSVITVYDMIFELFPEAFEADDQTAAVKRVAISRADHVICISENTKADLVRLYGTPPGKVSVVHLGFDQLAQCEHETGHREQAARPFLLYVGERSRSYKNFTGFLRAVGSSTKLLADFDIVAFGDPQFTSGELQTMVSLGFGEHQVRQMGGGDDVLGRVYAAATALVYPSLYEGFGIPPLEAMAHKCPVISSNASAMPEVIGIAAEYFDPNSLDDMRRAVESVVYSDSRAGELRKAGVERLKAFSWEKCAQQTLAIYKSLAQ